MATGAVFATWCFIIGAVMALAAAVTLFVQRRRIKIAVWLIVFAAVCIGFVILNFKLAH